MKRLLTNITLTVLITLAVACQQNTMSPRERTTSTIVTENEKKALAPVQLNWMGHWLYEDKRETLVRQVAQEFAFANQDIQVNLQFPQEIMDMRSKPLVAELIAKMIRTGSIEWDVIWMDDHIYQLVAEELDDPGWGARYLVNFETVAGFQDSQKSFIVQDPAYRMQTGGYLPTWAVLKDAPHREQAIQLVMFWSTPQVAEAWVRYTKNPTGIRGNVAIAETGADAFEQFQQTITNKYGSNVHYAADVGYLLGQEHKDLTQAVNAELGKLLTQQTTAQDAYLRIMSQVK